MPPAPLAQNNNTDHYYNYGYIKEEDGYSSRPMDMDNREDSMMISDDEYNRTIKKSKTSISSITNSKDIPINSSQNKYSSHSYTSLPTPLSSSPSNGNPSNSSSVTPNDHSNLFDHQDIEAAHLLISLRNCEKVC